MNSAHNINAAHTVDFFAAKFFNHYRMFTSDFDTKTGMFDVSFLYICDSFMELCRVEYGMSLLHNAANGMRIALDRIQPNLAKFPN